MDSADTGTSETDTNGGLHRRQEHPPPSYDTDKQDYAGISTGALHALGDLRDARDFAEMIVDTVREGLLVLDFDLRVVAANESFYRLFAVRPERTVGRLVYDLGTGQWELPELRELLEGILPRQKVFNDYEVEHDFERLGRRVMLLNARRLDDHQLILLAIEDVTERRTSERALRASEERFRLMASAVPQIVWITDAEGRAEFFNRQWTAYTGREYEPATAAEVAATAVHPDDAGVTMERFEEARRSGSIFQVEHRIRSAAGEYRWFLVRAEPYRDPESDRISRWFGASVDIHDRKLAEEALRESEERFRAVADLVPDLLWRSDAGGHTTWYNRRWLEYTGQTPEEAEGWGWAEAIHPDDRDGSRAEYRRSLEAGEPFQREHRIRRRDGVYRWFLVRTEPVRDEGGAVQQWFGTATDVHAQRTALETLEARVQERTRQVRELSRALALAEQEERQRIAYVLHEDLQQLLVGAKLMAGEGDPLTAVLDEGIELTRSLSHELSPPLLQGEDLSDLLGWVAERSRGMHGLGVEVEVDGGVSVPDPALRVLLYQLVRELLFNVVKHAGTAEARVTAEEEGGHVRVVVEDEGAGFDTAALDERSGLGLPSVRERLELVGGRLEVASAVGRGTRVTVTVPVRPA